MEQKLNVYHAKEKILNGNVLPLILKLSGVSAQGHSFCCKMVHFTPHHPKNNNDPESLHQLFWLLRPKRGHFETFFKEKFRKKFLKNPKSARYTHPSQK